MNPTPPSNELLLAAQHLRAGRLAETKAVCQEILQASPQEHEAYQLMGLASFFAGEHGQAEELLGRAIAIDPSVAGYYDNLCAVLGSQGRNEEAEAAARRALEIDPRNAEAKNNLAIALKAQGYLEEAVESFRQAIVINPNFALAANNLGNTLYALDRFPEAEEAYRQALAIDPNHAETSNNLGNALKAKGQLKEAEQAYRRALAIRPRYPQAENNLGVTLNAQDRLEEALAAYQRALAIQPAYPEAEFNLGNALKQRGRLQEAVDAYQRALAIQSNFAHAEYNMSTALKAQGRLQEAMDACRKAISLRPTDGVAHSGLLMIEQYRSEVSLASLSKAHKEWDERHAATFRTSWKPFSNTPDPDRRLRLGFVSADLKRHPVGHFLVRGLEAIDPRQFEIVCYYNETIKDDITERIAATAGSWQEVAGTSDESLAERIRSDGIDILVDLAGHTAENRLLVFARKPAPIQITWLGYVGTTGLAAMDYLIGDRFLVPKGSAKHYREKVRRLPDGHVCYDPPTDAPEVGPLPASEQGYVTFGSCNNLAKITPQVVQLWSKILSRLPDARLIFKHKGLGDEHARRRYTALFAEMGLDPSRMVVEGFTPLSEMLALHNRIDLALDPFPFSGSLTTCLALWMGVPVITCPGETFASRQSLSHLSNIGLTETIASDLADYVELAVGLAKDLSKLSELRAGLRERMARSPLCDGARFAENLMQQLRKVWREWTVSQQRT